MGVGIAAFFEAIWEELMKPSVLCSLEKCYQENDYQHLP
jgi:hypothetical protein